MENRFPNAAVVDERQMETLRSVWNPHRKTPEMGQYFDEQDKHDKRRSSIGDLQELGPIRKVIRKTNIYQHEISA